MGRRNEVWMHDIKTRIRVEAPDQAEAGRRIQDVADTLMARFYGLEIYRKDDGGSRRIAGHPTFDSFVIRPGRPTIRDPFEDMRPPSAEDEAALRAERIEEAATQLFITVWQGLQSGLIPDRTHVDDAAIRLRDALNPNPVGDPNWLPQEPQEG